MTEKTLTYYEARLDELKRKRKQLKFQRIVSSARLDSDAIQGFKTDSTQYKSWESQVKDIDKQMARIKRAIEAGKKKPGSKK